MLQQWLEATDADAGDAGVAAVDAVEAQDSRQHRLQTSTTKGGRQLLQVPDHLVFYPRGGGGYSNSAPNPYKKWNSWTCYSCGFDVPKWHTSATCPWECR